MKKKKTIHYNTLSICFFIWTYKMLLFYISKVLSNEKLLIHNSHINIALIVPPLLHADHVLIINSNKRLPFL